MLQLHQFYRRFQNIPPEKRNTLLTEVRHDPLTPMVIFKQLEYARQMQRFYTERVEELLRIAEETFNQVEL
jgi:hypothetical protein